MTDNGLYIGNNDLHFLQGQEALHTSQHSQPGLYGIILSTCIKI